MGLLKLLERRFGRFGLPNLTVGLILGQVGLYGVALSKPLALEQLELIPERVLDGEAWRLATFVFVPPITNPVCALFGWYLFYLMGTALEHSWGTFRYNAFLFVGWAATCAVAFGIPTMPATNVFLGTSVFLAFAFLYPDFTIHLMFVLPVRIYWLAVLTWIGIGYVVAFAPWEWKLSSLATVANFLLFFGGEILLRARLGHRRMSSQHRGITGRGGDPRVINTCATCGITSVSHPQEEFRYCSGCDGELAYCSAHLRNHEHVTAPATESAEA